MMAHPLQTLKTCEARLEEVEHRQQAPYAGSPDSISDLRAHSLSKPAILVFSVVIL